MSHLIDRNIRQSVRRLLRLSADALLVRWLGSINRTGALDRVAITLDDGPDGDVTPLMLDLLDDLEIRCSFFLLVNQCERYPELTREVVARGHEIGLHGRDHRRITTFASRASATNYLKAAKGDLEDIAGQSVRFYRPPYGSLNVRSFRAATAAGLDVAVWNADAQDWIDRREADVAALARDRVRPGGVLLFHERLEPDLPRAAPTTTFDRCRVIEFIVADCRRIGLEPATLGQMVHQGGALRSAWLRK